MSANPIKASITLDNLTRELNPVHLIPEYEGAQRYHHDAMDEAVKGVCREELERFAVCMADEFYAFKVTVAEVLNAHGILDCYQRDLRMTPFIVLAQKLHDHWLRHTRSDSMDLEQNNTNGTTELPTDI